MTKQLSNISFNDKLGEWEVFYWEGKKRVIHETCFGLLKAKKIAESLHQQLKHAKKKSPRIKCPYSIGLMDMWADEMEYRKTPFHQKYKQNREDK